MDIRQWSDELKKQLDEADKQIHEILRNLYHRPGGKQMVYARQRLSESRFWVDQGILEIQKEE